MPRATTRRRRSRVRRRPLGRRRPDARRRGRRRGRPRARLPAPAVRARATASGASSTRAGPTARRRTSRCAGRRASCAAPSAPADDLRALRAMVVRFAEQSEALRAAPLPALPRPPAARQHVVPPDRRRRARHAAGARTTRGCTSTRSRRTRCRARGCCASSATSIPNGAPRRWRVGEPFEAHARRYLGAIGRPLPGSAWLMATRRHHEAAPHRIRPRDAAAARPCQGRPEFQRNEPAGARRLRAGHDLGRATATRCCTPRWAAST